MTSFGGEYKAGSARQILLFVKNLCRPRGAEHQRHGLDGEDTKPYPQYSVPEKLGADSHALKRFVDGKPSQNDYRNGVRHVSLNPARRVSVGYSTCCQCIIT